jgi:hypothetical protein
LRSRIIVLSFFRYAAVILGISLFIALIWCIDHSSGKAFFIGIMQVLGGSLTLAGVFLTLKNQKRQLSEEHRLDNKPFLSTTKENTPSRENLIISRNKLDDSDISASSHDILNFGIFDLKNIGKGPAEVIKIRFTADNLDIEFRSAMRVSIGINQVLGINLKADSTLYIKKSSNFEYTIYYKDIFGNMYKTHVECSTPTTEGPSQEYRSKYIYPQYISETAIVSLD